MTDPVAANLAVFADETQDRQSQRWEGFRDGGGGVVNRDLTWKKVVIRCVACGSMSAFGNLMGPE